ncbi:MAG TPA: hypothetical protein G4N94_06560 [Caldilineae bacterium]|nr:hypothetical protein [Caldilineae bacterium]
MSAPLAPVCYTLPRFGQSDDKILPLPVKYHLDRFRRFHPDVMLDLIE